MLAIENENVLAADAVEEKIEPAETWLPRLMHVMEDDSIDPETFVQVVEPYMRG